MPNNIFFPQLLSKNSQLENLENSVQTWKSLIFVFAVKTKNKAILCFKHNIVYWNWINFHAFVADLLKQVGLNCLKF